MAAQLRKVYCKNSGTGTVYVDKKEVSSTAERNLPYQQNVYRYSSNK